MEIILLENIELLGLRGDVVQVKNGYARNYLIPRGLGAIVNAENLRRIDSLKKKLRQEDLERMGMLREMAARLDSLSLTIQAKVNEEGHLFGSVSSSMIHEALASEGVEIDAKTIRLEENIKEVGVYMVPIHLHAEIQAKLRVWVVEERSAQEGGHARLEADKEPKAQEDEK